MSENLKILPILRQYPEREQKNGKTIELYVVEIGKVNPGIVHIKQEIAPNMPQSYVGLFTGDDGNPYTMKFKDKEAVLVVEGNKLNWVK